MKSRLPDRPLVMVVRNLKGTLAINNDRSKASGAFIAVCEDNRYVRDFLLIALTEAGYRVLAAADGKTMLEIIVRHEERPLLLLTGQNITGMNGIELVKGVRGMFADLPVIMISGLSNPMEEERGNFVFLKKPLMITSLLREIRCLLRCPEPGLSA